MSYYWLLTPFALFAGYVAIRTALQAAILLWRVAMIVAVDVAEKMSRAIALAIMEGIGLGAFYAGRWMGMALAPIVRKTRAARKVRDRQEQNDAWDQLNAALGAGSAQAWDRACEIMALPKKHSRTDLESRHRLLAKRTHPDHGGTAWLFEQVTWAYKLLKGDAT